jgi:hypothetical protein
MHNNNKRPATASSLKCHVRAENVWSGYTRSRINAARIGLLIPDFLYCVNSDYVYNVDKLVVA